MMDDRPASWDALSDDGPGTRSVTVVFTTMLTKRRAVDHCRVRSSLCRSC